MKHLGTIQIETPRLILRKFAVEDAPAAYENWTNDDDVTKFLTWQTHSSVDVTKDVLTDWVSRYVDDSFYQWAITVKSNGNEPIGSISSVRQNDNVKMVHIGYCIGKKWWAQGVTSEALQALMTFFFEQVGVNRIESQHVSDNPNSGKVMLKCGMIKEGVMRQSGMNNQGICDMVMYGILAEDYRKMNQEKA